MPPLERDVQLAALEDRLEAARSGQGHLVFVRGPAGIGKSALIEHFADRVDTVRVLVGACDALSTPRPLGPITDIVTHLGEETRFAVSERSRTEVFDVFLRDLRRRTVVVVIEDAHWADEATLDLIRFLGRRMRDTRGLLIVTYRDDELAATHPLRIVVGDLATSDAVTTLELPPLSREAVATLARETGTHPTLDTDTLHERTGGNPFFITEVLASGEQPVPPTVRDAVLARIARLTPEARSAVEAASVTPTRLETWLLRELAAVDSTAIDEAVEGAILRNDAPGMVAFRHELARLAVHDTVPPARRTNLHEAAATLLLERSGETFEPARVAHHAEEAGRSDLAREHAVRAAVRATELGAHREAAEQYERALRHAEGIGAGERAGLLEAYAREASATDQMTAALEAITETVTLRREQGDPRALGTALRLHARILWLAGEGDEADNVVREAVAVLEETDPGEELAEAYALLATLAMLAREHADVLRWGERAIELADRTGAEHALARALNTVGSSRILTGDPGRGREELERSIHVAAAAGLDQLVAGGWTNLGSAAGEIRDYGPAAEALPKAIAHAEERDLDFAAHYATAWLARVRFEQGEWEQAERLATGLPLDHPGTAAITKIVALTVLGRLRARRGAQPPIPELDTAWELAQRTGDLQRLWPVAAGRAEAAWLSGDRAQVPDVVDEVYTMARELGHAWAIGELGLWRWRGGADGPLPDGAAEPYALHVSGRVGAAAARWEELGCPYEVTDTLSDSGRTEELERGLEIADQLGAEPTAARIRRELRRRGVRVRRGPRPATAEHPVGLTPRQAEVLDLVTRGLTNPEIAERLYISPKTVEHHVSAILDKLDADSRGEAAHRARELGIVEPNRPDGGGPGPT